MLMYNDSQLVNFATSGKMSFDFISQQSYVEKIGIDNYISKFKIWFSESTGGSC